MNIKNVQREAILIVYCTHTEKHVHIPTHIKQ